MIGHLLARGPAGRCPGPRDVDPLSVIRYPLSAKAAFADLA